LQLVTWQNWMKNEAARARLFTPRSIDELSAGLSATHPSRALPGPVRSVGKSKSWSGMVTTTGTLVSLERMGAVLALDPNERAPSVTVQPGITVRALTDYLYERGYYLPGAPMHRDISVGGVLATGSHGYNRRAGGIDSAVISLKLCDARGEVRSLSAEDGDAFRAACVSLGALGVVVEVRLRIEPAETLLVDDFIVPAEEVIDRIEDLALTYENLCFFWFPPSLRVCLRGSNRSGERAKVGSPLERARERARGAWSYSTGRLVQPIIARHAPSLVPLTMWLGERVMSEGRSFVGRPNHVLHNMEEVPPNWSMGFSLPIERAADAWRALGEAHRLMRGRPGFVPSFPAYARLIGPSESLMAPSYGRRTIMLEVVTAPGTRHHWAFYRELEAAMRGFPEARQHWGKLVMDPRGVALRFPEHARFAAVCELYDPERRFMNRFVEAAFEAPRTTEDQAS
jgi:hypothetical protein